MSPVPSDLLQMARAGEIDSLRQLSTKVLSQSNYTVAALDSALIHLSWDKFINTHCDRCVSLGLDRADRAMPVVALSAYYCHRSATTKAETVARLLEEIDGILAWVHLLLSSLVKEDLVPGAIPLNARCMQFIQELGALDPQLESAIMASPQMVGIVLVLWSRDPEEGDSPEVAISTLDLMVRLVDSTAGFELLCDRLESSSVAQNVYNGLEERLLALPKLNKNGLPKRKLLRLLRDLSQIVARLIMEPSMDALFQMFGLVQEWSNVLVALLGELNDEEFLQSLNVLLRFAIRPGFRSPIPDLESVVLSPLIPALAKCLNNAGGNWGSKKSEATTAIIDDLRTYAYYTKILLPLARVAEEYHTVHPLVPPESEIDSESRGHPQSEWYQLVYTLNIILKSIPIGEVDEETDRILARLCDNESHFDIWPNNDHWTHESKSCSGCRSSRYCSDRCQQLDWGNRHRRLCKELSDVYKQRRRHEIRYSASAQYVHRELVSALCADVFSSPDAAVEFEGACERQFVLAFDTCQPLGQRLFMKIPWDMWLGRPLRADCPFDDVVALEMVAKWRATEIPKTRIVEAYFQYSPYVQIYWLMEVEYPRGNIVQAMFRIPWVVSSLCWHIQLTTPRSSYV